MKARFSQLRVWLAYSPQRRLAAALLVLLVVAVAAVGGALASAQLRSQPKAAVAPSMTATEPASTASPRISQPTALPTPVPTATLGQITGIGARPHVYPRLSPDLTLGSLPQTQTQTSSGLAFTPDPRYTAEDTLTDTGPGPPGPLTGLPTKPAYANRPAVAVVIDNFDPDARPQAGLNRASVVFETVAEGGITRFMAIYLEKDAPIIGPVRSARIYFDAWAAGMHAVYGHAGGNNDALSEIPKIPGLANVDGLAPGAANPFPWDLYWRSTDRLAPHNFYTASDRLRSFAEAVGRTAAQPFVPTLAHKAPAAIFTRPNGGWIHIDFSSSSYTVQYLYDPKCNCYPRSMNGTAHVDEFSLRQIAPSNVAVLYAGVLPDPASDTPGSVNVQTVGSGRALFFRDGTLVQGTWRKDSVTAPLTFEDSLGQPVAFNPGQTWLEVVPIGQQVTWQLHR